MKRFIIAIGFALAALSAGTAAAREVTVEITNLTNGTYFTPLLVSAHSRHMHLFTPGSPASAHLRAMAEGGDISGLTADLQDAGATFVANPANGLLAPGNSTSATLDIRPYGRMHYLSIVAMLIPTNDGFVGLDALPIPKEHGRHVYYLNAYDAGTEANDEIITGGGAPGVPGIPAAPGGRAGTGGTGEASEDANKTVHIHPGIIGDLDPNGGPSDLDPRYHRWQNPVAKVVVTVR